MNRAVLLQKLQGIYQRLVLGDRTLAGKVAEWKRLAKAGHPRAKVVYNSLAVLHWRKRDVAAFARAEVFYNRLRAYDRAAHAELRSLVGRERAGDPKAQAIFSALKAVHHKRKASLWSQGPGAPSTGYYPMPSQNRVGIEIPAAPYTRHEAMSRFLPLTPQAEAMLVGLIHETIASVGRAQAVERLQRAPGVQRMLGAAASVAPFVMSTTPRSSATTSTPKPFLSSTVRTSTLSPMR